MASSSSISPKGGRNSSSSKAKAGGEVTTTIAPPPFAMNNSHSCTEISTSKALHITNEDNPNLIVYLKMENIIERMQKEESGKDSGGREVKF